MILAAYLLFTTACVWGFIEGFQRLDQAHRRISVVSHNARRALQTKLSFKDVKEMAINIKLPKKKGKK